MELSSDSWVAPPHPQRRLKAWRAPGSVGKRKREAAKVCSTKCAGRNAFSRPVHPVTFSFYFNLRPPPWSRSLDSTCTEPSSSSDQQYKHTSAAQLCSPLPPNPPPFDKISVTSRSSSSASPLPPSLCNAPHLIGYSRSTTIQPFLETPRRCFPFEPFSCQS